MMASFSTSRRDMLAALKRWNPPDMFAGVTSHQLYNIQLLVEKNPDKARKHSASKHWVGKIVAHVLDRNLDKQGVKQAIDEMIRAWLDNGVLKTVERQDETRHVHEYVEVGRWVEE